MPTQRRYEANTLAAVLAKVQKEVGHEAKISSAQRTRSGGVFGFFQREKFEVLVEISDTPSTGSSSAASPTGGRAKTGKSAKTDKQVQGRRAEDAKAPASLLELAEQVNDVERPGSKAVGSRSVAGGAGSGDAGSGDAGRSGARAEHAESEPEIDEPDISTESQSFAEILSRIAFQSDMRSTAPGPASEATPATGPGSDDEDDDDDEDEVARPVIEDRPAFLDVRPVEPAGTSAVDRAGQSQAGEAVVPAARTRITDSPLAGLGLPVPFIPELPENWKSSQVQKALIASLEQLPKPPVIRPSKGSIIAVVGPREEAMELAEELAHQWGRPKEEVVLASQHYRGKGSANIVRNVRSAEDSRRSWSRRSRPTIVAVEAHMGPRETIWAEHILTALEPIATYGTVDATRKAEDIAAWADSLGGVDCLAVNYAEETVSPAAVLATGIPVERIDGRKATPAYWAMLLTERLTA